jgi:hypothetical protein
MTEPGGLIEAREAGKVISGSSTPEDIMMHVNFELPDDFARRLQAKWHDPLAHYGQGVLDLLGTRSFTQEPSGQAPSLASKVSRSRRRKTVWSVAAQGERCVKPKARTRCSP